MQATTGLEYMHHNAVTGAYDAYGDLDPKDGYTQFSFEPDAAEKMGLDACWMIIQRKVQKLQERGEKLPDRILVTTADFFVYETTNPYDNKKYRFNLPADIFEEADTQ